MLPASGTSRKAQRTALSALASIGSREIREALQPNLCRSCSERCTPRSKWWGHWDLNPDQRVSSA